MKIVQAPQQVLAEIAKDIPNIDKAIKNLIAEMSETLQHAKDPEGVGLAAPQVGKSLQMFLVKESKKTPLRVFINPKITIPKEEKLPTPEEIESGEKKEVKLEGCLSLQDIWGVVYRYKRIVLTYQDETGEEFINKEFDGFLATIIQHEVDHLNGILFPRRVLEQDGELYKSTINKKGEMEFEQIAV